MIKHDSIIEYVICGPGRCGGHLVLGLLKSAGVQAVRTHDINYTNGKDQNTVWIKVDRREIFDAVCSNVIANRTSQTTHYDRTSIAPFYVGKEEFQFLYQAHLEHRKDYQKHRNFFRYDRIWYEDFAQNHSMIWDLFDLVPDTTLMEKLEIQHLINTPAPYNYRELIINYKELREFIIY